MRCQTILALALVAMLAADAGAVTCTTDANCAGQAVGEWCDALSGECMPCNRLTEGGCPAGEQCIKHPGTGIIGCAACDPATNDGCASTLYCTTFGTSQPVCSTCSVYAEFDATSNKVVNLGCTGGTPVCSALNTCVAGCKSEGRISSSQNGGIMVGCTQLASACGALGSCIQPSDCDTTAPDGDNDDIHGPCDNAPTVWNPEQGDYDRDGSPDVEDECPGHFEPAQTNSDTDCHGDGACV